MKDARYHLVRSEPDDPSKYGREPGVAVYLETKSVELTEEDIKKINLLLWLQNTKEDDKLARLFKSIYE